MQEYLLSFLIQETRKEFTSTGNYRGINQGWCEKFAEEVIDNIPLCLEVKETSNLHEEGGDVDAVYFIHYGMFTEEIDENGYDDRWEIDLINMFGFFPDTQKLQSTPPIPHVWLYFRGRHYDAECPEGVNDFLDLPVYKRSREQINIEPIFKGVI